MSRKVFNKINSGSSSAVPMGFDADSHLLGIHHSVLCIFPVPPKPARRYSADLSSEGSPQVLNETRDNMAGFVFAKDRISSNPSDKRDILAFPAEDFYLK